MPENLFSEMVFKIDKFQNTISLQRSTEINQLGIALVFLFVFGFSAGNSLTERTVVSFGVFDTGYNTGFGEVFGYAFGDRERGSDKGLALNFLAVFELSKIKVLL